MVISAWPRPQVPRACQNCFPQWLGNCANPAALTTDSFEWHTCATSHCAKHYSVSISQPPTKPPRISFTLPCPGRGMQFCGNGTPSIYPPPVFTWGLSDLCLTFCIHRSSTLEDGRTFSRSPMEMSFVDLLCTHASLFVNQQKDHTSCLTRRLDTWREGYLNEEGRTIQHRIRITPPLKKEQLSLVPLLTWCSSTIWAGNSPAGWNCHNSEKGELSLINTLQALPRCNHVHPVLFKSLDATSAALNTSGAAGRRLCTSFKSASADLCLINTPSELFLDGDTLISKEGTTQGDPLAMPVPLIKKM